MHPDLENAKEALKTENCSCVLAMGNIMFKSHERGVRPLVDWLNSGNSYVGYMIADKVVGRAAAFIHIALGVREVYAEVMSEGAKELLDKNHINAYAGEIIPEILTKDGTETCPLERAVEGIENPGEALMPIELALIRMNL